MKNEPEWEFTSADPETVQYLKEWQREVLALHKSIHIQKPGKVVYTVVNGIGWNGKPDKTEASTWVPGTHYEFGDGKFKHYYPLVWTKATVFGKYIQTSMDISHEDLKHLNAMLLTLDWRLCNMDGMSCNKSLKYPILVYQQFLGKKFLRRHSSLAHYYKPEYTGKGVIFPNLSK